MSVEALQLDPVMAALLAAHAEEKAAQQAHVEQVERAAETERLYLFRGELYSRREIDTFCPYLQSLGAEAVERTIVAYEYHGPIPETHTVQEVEAKESKEAQAKTTQQVEAGGSPIMGGSEDELVKALTETSVVAELQPEKILSKPPIKVSKSEQVVAPNPTTKVIKIPAIVPLKAVESKPVAAAPIYAETLTADAVPKMQAMQEIAAQTAEVELLDAPQAKYEEAALPTEENASVESFDQELLAEVEPQLAVTVAAIAEHASVETLTMPELPKLTAETTKAIVEFMQTATPEQAVVVEALTVLVESAVDRLTTLAQKEQLDSPEATAIIELVIEWYEELSKCGVAVNNKSAHFLLADVLKNAGVTEQQVEQLLSNKHDGTREFKLYDPRSLQQPLSIDNTMRYERWPLGWLSSLVA